MASGETLVVFTPLHNEPPTSINATLDTRNAIPVLDFDAATDEEAVFGGFLPDNYAGGGLTVTLVNMASTATSGNMVYQAAIERWSDDDVDLDTDSFAAFQASGQILAPTVSGEVTYDDITFTSGSQMDGLLKNEAFRLKVRRDADSTTATDDMSGDSELMRAIIKET